MPKLTIDGQPVEVAEGATVLDAARALGVAIPALCQRDGFEPSTSCMACVVQIGDAPALRPSCATVATEGMAIRSETDEVREARRTSLELLLSDHAGDCIAPCQLADDRHADLPRFLRQVADGDLDAAKATLASSAFDLDDPESLQVRRAEKACRRGRHDEPVAIEALIRYVAAYRADAAAPASPPTSPPPPPPPYRAGTSRLGKMTAAEMQALLDGARAGKPSPPADPEHGYTAEEARAEALRCMHCDCPAANSCKLRDACDAYDVKNSRLRVPRPEMSVDRSHGTIMHEPGKCIRCGLCLQVAEQFGEKLGISFVGRGFDMSVKVPFQDPLAQALESAGANCADVCPTAALWRRGG